MSEFLDPLTVTEIDDSTFAVAVRPFRYKSDLAGLITVPVGFYTDFASVPRLGLIYSLLGNYAHQPAVIHDWLYYSAITTRTISDKVILEAMNVISIPFWRRGLIYEGLKIGGWWSWNKHRKLGHSEKDFQPKSE